MDPRPCSVWVWQCFRAPATNTRKPCAGQRANWTCPLRSWSAGERSMSAVHSTLWCFPEENPPPCASPAGTNPCWLRCLTGWTPIHNAPFWGPAQGPSCSHRRAKAVHPTLPPASHEMRGGGNGIRLRRWSMSTSTPPNRRSNPPPPSVETVFLTSRWRWPHRALLNSPTASRACSFGPPDLRTAPWPARPSPVWGTRWLGFLTARNWPSRSIPS